MAGPAVAPASTAAEVHLLVANLTSRTALIELAAFVGCLLLAWALVRLLRGPLAPRENSVWFGQRIVDGVMFPLLALLLALFTRWLLQGQVPTAVFKLVVPILMSLAAIRLTVRVLHQAFPTSPVVRLFERTFSWVAWIAVVLWVTGILPLLLAELDQITWKLGGTTISVRNLLEGAISAVVVLMVTLWLSSLLEQRLLRGAVENLSMRKMAANALRALLLFMGLLFALSAAGIDLTALGVLGGALGVGIGFGMQKIAANYISGFIILFDKSIEPGRLIRVDRFRGTVAEIRTRYTVLHGMDGVDAIVPNEMLVNSVVESETFTNNLARAMVQVGVAYASDVERAMALMVEAARAQPRVLTDPAPMAFLVAFADSGITLELGFWINDPKTGTLALRSDINLAILRSFRGAGIDIPFPQREVTIRGGSGAVVAGEPAVLPGAPRPAPSAAGPSPQR